MKEQVVYLDILLGVNLLVNYFMLLLTARIASMPVKRFRLLLAALLGAVYSLIIFAPKLNLFFDLGLKALFAVTITATAFGIKNKKSFVRSFCIFIVSTFLFGGAAIGLYFLTSPRGMIINNSAVYINISALNLIIYTIVAYLLLSLIQFLSKRRAPQELAYKVTIGFSGRKVTVGGIVDTGNSLCESFSQTPVAVCGLSDIKDILPVKLIEMISQKDVLGSFHKLSASEFATAVRIIPYHDVSGEGILLAFKPESFVLEQKGKLLNVKDVYVGVSNKPVTRLDYSCILNPKIIELSVEKRSAGAYEG